MGSLKNRYRPRPKGLKTSPQLVKPSQEETAPPRLFDRWLVSWTRVFLTKRQLHSPARRPVSRRADLHAKSLEEIGEKGPALRNMGCPRTGTQPWIMQNSCTVSLASGSGGKKGQLTRQAQRLCDFGCRTRLGQEALLPSR